MFSKVITQSGNDDDSVVVGVGFYYIEDNNERLAKVRVARCHMTAIKNSKYRRRVVFYDSDGKAVMTGWMRW